MQTFLSDCLIEERQEVVTEKVVCNKLKFTTIIKLSNASKILRMKLAHQLSRIWGQESSRNLALNIQLWTAHRISTSLFCILCAFIYVKKFYGKKFQAG
ncbi:hypothetical protein IGI04_015866 [Brassica rapa subsp. trilocularis]|uniref:Uncharacterized protein n=1 Tax=Brassica rapa subsp. trilocularis TaxID=1813537 RepID=A0ABQ7MRC5_BRACM|nr:hypothetical protein IGI04_015866 [Brassica rapa subsp. trilocularis]